MKATFEVAQWPSGFSNHKLEHIYKRENGVEVFNPIVELKIQNREKSIKLKKKKKKRSGRAYIHGISRNDSNRSVLQEIDNRFQSPAVSS